MTLLELLEEQERCRNRLYDPDMQERMNPGQTFVPPGTTAPLVSEETAMPVDSNEICNILLEIDPVDA